MVVGVFSGWAEAFSIWFNGVSFGWHLHQSVILVRFSVGLWFVFQLVCGSFFSWSVVRFSVSRWFVFQLVFEAFLRFGEAKLGWFGRAEQTQVF